MMEYHLDPLRLIRDLKSKGVSVLLWQQDKHYEIKKASGDSPFIIPHKSS